MRAVPCPISAPVAGTYHTTLSPSPHTVCEYRAWRSTRLQSYSCGAPIRDISTGHRLALHAMPVPHMGHRAEPTAVGHGAYALSVPHIAPHHTLSPYRTSTAPLPLPQYRKFAHRASVTVRNARSTPNVSTANCIATASIEHRNGCRYNALGVLGGRGGGGRAFFLGLEKRREQHVDDHADLVAAYPRVTTGLRKQAG
eukprot:3813165-Rhodomonas_salina.1